MRTHTERREKAEKMLSGLGYGKMKSIADHAVHAHESHMHKGKKPTKLACGGRAEGGEVKHRMDRKPRAAGGRNMHGKGKGKSGNHVKINVINTGKQPVPVPVPQHPPMGGAPMPPPGAMPPRPPMQPPMGARPPMPPPGAGMGAPMMSTGGRMRRAGGGPVRSKGDIPHLEGGSGGGLARLQKEKFEAKRKKAS